MNVLSELFRENFYALDFSVGLLAPLIVYALCRTGRLDRYFWTLFWVGFGIGLTWEVPCRS